LISCHFDDDSQLLKISTYQQISGKITSGTVIVKGDIRQFTETSVIFEDGVELKDVDEVVMATGYWFEFPYLDSGRLVEVKANRCKLYKKMFPLPSADKNTLAVIGLVQVCFLLICNV
jgi:dimethylaniline monooxygenase (N-oxide forming)